MVPVWLTLLSALSLIVGGLVAVFIGMDEAGHPQKMWIMAVVWPVAALFGSLLVLWFYLAHGRGAPRGEGGEPHKGGAAPPMPVAVAKGTLHCGAGCTLGDIAAEALLTAVPAIAVALGWGTLFADKLFAAWIADYVLAFVLGIAFQYFTIAPMRGLGLRDGIVAALKADALSLTAWQVGMYGFMAIAYFGIFRGLFGVRLGPERIEFWFMMQIAMLVGFCTAYPVNWWLVSAGLKEKM